MPHEGLSLLVYVIVFLILLFVLLRVAGLA